MSHDDTGGEARIQLTLAVIFSLIVVGGVGDLILDRPTSLLSLHVLFEVGLVLVSLGAATYLARGWYSTSVRLGTLERTVEEQRLEREAWRSDASDALASFREAVGKQFDTWSLSPAEREVALALLAGRSLKRIARDTDRSERTVRQHAVSVYRKAGLAGRAELAGFFLGGLLPSAVPTDREPATR